MTRSEQLFALAQELIPGGVNSPVRAFGSVGGTPRFIQEAKGSSIKDVDGNQYIDFVGSWGPMILGHNHPEICNAVIETAKKGLSFGAATELEVQMADLITSMVPSIEMVRMVNSGTEAVMSAIRAARGYTKKDKIIKVAGCYHGHSDAMLVKAGSGVMTAGIPDSAGVPAGCAQDTLTAIYNNIDSVRELFEAYPNEIAAVIIEPVAANMGVVCPQANFLQQLRALCDQYRSVLIFDEVITGFRLGMDGAQGWFQVTPDLTTYGKIIGAGMPVGAYGGKREIMETVSPVGPVYQAGTLSGNPLAMAAGNAQIKYLQENPYIYEEIEQKGAYIESEFKKSAEKYGVNVRVNRVGSMMSVFFTNSDVINFETASKSDTEKFKVYFNEMLKQGIYLAPSQFESLFLSDAHTQYDLEKTAAAFDKVMEILR